MKRVKKVGTLVIISLFIAVAAYAESDSVDITVRMKVLPVSTLELTEESVESNMLVRTTVVGGETYREVIPLPEE